MKQEVCDHLIAETEQSFQKMDLDFYEVMKKAPAIVEKWKRYAPLCEELWKHAGTRDELRAFLLPQPEPSPKEVESVLTLIRTLPYLLRSLFQEAAKSLPPSPGGHPPGLTPEQRKQVCLQIGELYGMGVELRDAQDRMAKRYGVGLRTIQRAWQERGKWNPNNNGEIRNT